MHSAELVCSPEGKKKKQVLGLLSWENMKTVEKHSRNNCIGLSVHEKEGSREGRKVREFNCSRH